MALFDYPVTREVRIRYFKIVVAMLAALYLGAITAINVYAVGYEWKTVIDSDFNNTLGRHLWYEKLIPSSAKNYFPDTWKCSQSVINIT